MSPLLKTSSHTCSPTQLLLTGLLYNPNPPIPPIPPITLISPSMSYSSACCPLVYRTDRHLTASHKCNRICCCPSPRPNASHRPSSLLHCGTKHGKSSSLLYWPVLVTWQSLYLLRYLTVVPYADLPVLSWRNTLIVDSYGMEIEFLSEFMVRCPNKFQQTPNPNSGFVVSVCQPCWCLFGQCEKDMWTNFYHHEI